MNAVIKYKYLTFLITLGFILFIAFNAKAEVLLLDAIESWPPKLTDANPVENVEEDKKENNGYFHFNYYFSGDVDFDYDLELSVPIFSTFSLLVKGAYFNSKVEDYRYHSTWAWSYWRGYYRRGYWSRYSYTEKFWDCSPLIMWEPFKGSLFSPYIAAGARFSHFDTDEDYIYGAASKWGYVAIAGLRLNLGFVTLRGEYALGPYGESDATEILGDIGISITDFMQLHVNYKIFDCDDAVDSLSMYGGGISFGF